MSQPSPVQPSPVLPKRSNRNVAMLLIVAGAIVLLYNSGTFGSILFSTVAPVALIAFGFDLLTEGLQRRRAVTGAVLAAVVLMPLMGIAQFMGPERPRAVSDGPRKGYIGTIEDIDRVRAHIKLTAGQLSIGRLSEGNMEVVALDSEGGQEPSFHRDDRIGFLDIDRPLGGDDLDLDLTQRVPVNLAIEMGNGDAAPLDFEGIKLEALDLNLGYGSSEIKLPDQGVMEIRITGTAGELELDVPDELAARIKVETQWSDVEVDDRFKLQDGVYVSEGYSDDAENRATINIKMAYGNIVIR